MNTDNPRRIQLLRDSVSRKIAAGEVIDRPFSVIRELLDNSLDAESSEIRIDIKKGGTEEITVTDNGIGMTKEDLQLCCKPHATSKIENENDLLHIRTLGFRGEAMSSIAACSRLEILASRHEGKAWKLKVVNGKEQITPFRGPAGTRVTVEDLFYSYPARKKFLKRPASETAACTSMVQEKAIPFPDVTFRYFTDEKLRFFLPPSDLPGRIRSIYSKELGSATLFDWESTGDGFTLRIIAAAPEYSQRDRKLIQTFVNKRKIQEYSFIHAAQYGFNEYIPGGRFPAVFIFLEIDPQLVDFNIHPAKREAKFQNIQELHHHITSELRQNLRKEIGSSISAYSNTRAYAKNEQEELGFPQEQSRNTPKSSDTQGHRPVFRELENSTHNYHNKPSVSKQGEWAKESVHKTMNTAAKNKPEKEEEMNSGRTGFYYFGQALGVFLIVQYKDSLYLIDQHAAHERILFNSFSAESKSRQPLLVPAEFETASSQTKVLRSISDELLSAGIEIVEKYEGQWLLKTVPASMKNLETKLITFLQGEAGITQDLISDLYASMSCKAAIKDGETVTPYTAQTLIEKAFALEQPRCPHGRPIWFQLSREELFKLIGRTVH
ncbi:MAG: DNA mismatch repair endonuclease MutL [Spirochaetia bacterium]